ncbi:MAG TPA: YdeI/OmpD-associated family protein [Solirubrobacteraceae bacterium]
MQPTFFATPEDLRAWLEAHHDSETELLVGFHKKGLGRPSITWPESVDQALCFGWIDGVRRRIDDDSYSIRFTPRKQRSTWSAVNLRRVGELTELGLVRPAGLAAFERRSDDRTAIYAYEQRRTAKLDAEQERRFRANAGAWKWFQAQPAGYRRTASYWVISARRPQTRERRLEQLIENSAAGRTIRSLTPPSARGASGAARA